MGVRLARFEFQPGENEQIEAVIKIPEEPRSIIHGIVVDSQDKVIENAVVKLFEVENPCNPCSLRPISHTFTDESGQFLFGPLTPGVHYVIKVWVSDINQRNFVIYPEKVLNKSGFEEEVTGEDKHEAIENINNTGEEKASTQVKPRNTQQRKTRII